MAGISQFRAAVYQIYAVNPVTGNPGIGGRRRLEIVKRPEGRVGRPGAEQNDPNTLERLSKEEIEATTGKIGSVEGSRGASSRLRFFGDREPEEGGGRRRDRARRA
ncbi:hypothetical protein KM043_005173 [Ampulex compressa]|nr:hypothetical protein KM043_005173 [Ampulex compressa]